MTLPKTLINFLWYFIQKQKWYFLLIQLLALAWAMDNTVWPYALSLLIDKLMAFTGDKAEIWVYLAPILVFWAGMWIAIEIMFRSEGIFIARVFPKFEAQIRMKMFQYVEGHSYNYFSSHFAGNISNKISDMANSATRIMQLIMTLFIPALLAFIIAGGMFLAISPIFAGLLMGWAALHIGICLFSAKRCCELSDIHSTSRSYMTGKIVDTFTNIMNVKLFSRQKFEYDYVKNFQNDEKIKHRHSLMAVEKVKIWLGISSLIFPVTLMTWYQIYSFQHDLITIGELVLIFNTTWNIMLVAWFAGLELPNLFKEIGVAKQALSIIKAEHEIVDTKNASIHLINQGEIEFNNVHFGYHKTNPLFKNLNVTLAAGSKVGLVGFSGSGKTTFVNLIMRFYDIHQGNIMIDGTDIRQFTLECLRKQIAMIPQDPTLFHRTIMENIRYGKIDATDEEIFQASDRAHCVEFIKSLPEGYQSLVGERGTKLSGGQRQRIAIARAILKNAPILILDEATSALDSITEKRIQDALQYLMQGRTTLIVAHRLSTLSEMDRILVFDRGRIIEDGTHTELLNLEGYYYKLWHMQAGGFLPDTIEE